MSLSRVRFVCAYTLVGVFALGMPACDPNKIEYEPKPAPSGDRPSLPPVANVPKRPIKGKGGAYTVWGASYYLRSRVHHEEVAGKEISITGWIGYTNLMDAPECAVHKGGKGDPEGCTPDVPAFWICDQKGDKKDDCIRVSGWASNYAQIYDAIEKYDKDEDAEQMDTYWGMPLPKPLPNVGAEVTVTGPYSTTFTKLSTGAEADPIMGIQEYSKMEYLTPPPTLATLPGVKRKEPKEAPGGE